MSFTRYAIAGVIAAFVLLAIDAWIGAQSDAAATASRGNGADESYMARSASANGSSSPGRGNDAWRSAHAAGGAGGAGASRQASPEHRERPPWEGKRKRDLTADEREEAGITNHGLYARGQGARWSYLSEMARSLEQPDLAQRMDELGQELMRSSVPRATTNIDPLLERETALLAELERSGVASGLDGSDLKTLSLLKDQRSLWESGEASHIAERFIEEEDAEDDAAQVNKLRMERVDDGTGDEGMNHPASDEPVYKNEAGVAGVSGRPPT